MNRNFQKSLRGLDWLEQVRRRIACAVFLAVVASVSLTVHDARAQSCTPYGNAPATLTGSDNPIVPLCTGGQRLGPWSDSDGSPRYSCLYESTNASTSNPLPLVVFLHPSLATADTLEAGTNILTFLNTANVTDNSSKLGFIALAPEGRDTTHFYPDGDASGPGWDNWYRQFNPSGDVQVKSVTYKENVDAATIDHFIAAEVATGKVDTNRIYVTGWSNGAAMSYLYGTSRPNIAAIAPYSVPNPWAAFNDPCIQTPVATKPKDISQLQIYNFFVPTNHFHNQCDISGICPNGEFMLRQLIPTGVSVQDTLLDWTGTPFPSVTPGPVPANACDDLCGTNPLASIIPDPGALEGLLNHIRWPEDYTVAILDFFRAHPLSARPQVKNGAVFTP